MALYSIESDVCLGMSHSGPVNVEGESAVELSDDEVKILVDLIREKDSTDVDDLGLEESHPALYRKLDYAYHDMAYKAEELHWLWEGYHSGYFEYDEDELVDYCEKHCGFKFEYDEKDFYWDDPEDLEEGEEPEIDEDALNDARHQAFSKWLDDYVTGLDDDEVCNFFYNHMHAGLDIDHVDYTVEIPGAIISKALEQ